MTWPVRSGGRGIPPAKAVGARTLLVLLLLAGCDRSTPTQPPRPTVPAGPGVVAGVVRFVGPVPNVPPPTGTCCPGVPQPPDDRLAVNADGTLRDVTVYVENGPNVDIPPPAKAVLAQRGCQYVPHALALRVGQALVVTSADPTTHNVLITSDHNPKQNFDESIPGAARTVTFDAADADVNFRCSVHAWMHAHAMVFDHPCFAVTADGGAFRIEHLPPGTYTLVAHHELFEDQRQTVTVTAAQPTVDVAFTFKP